MTEDITWHPLGTITFRGFTDGDREMRRPNFGQLRYFSIQLKRIADEAQETGKEMQERLERALESEDDDKARAIVAEVNDYTLFGFIDRVLEWHREVFEQLSTELPDEAQLPAYFADPSLASEIVNHWKRRPKVSGPTTREQ